MSPLSGGKQRFFFVENSSGYKNTAKAIEALTKSFKKADFFPKMPHTFDSRKISSLFKK